MRTVNLARGSFLPCGSLFDSLLWCHKNAWIYVKYMWRDWQVAKYIFFPFKQISNMYAFGISLVNLFGHGIRFHVHILCQQTSLGQIVSFSHYGKGFHVSAMKLDMCCISIPVSGWNAWLVATCPLNFCVLVLLISMYLFSEVKRVLHFCSHCQRRPR